ncbi:MAG: tRNA threonylcarbamoyladenosine dehydratase [Erysipelotrichia bacterium]|nr:tRNA threonylcarbamoyladenosine dehydratase [Erysipelotrichia bacterium]NCC54875.1 tRNA threonylcarbamoyladenosine dehydratase [Erysipelotrichia bacterium]
MNEFSRLKLLIEEEQFTSLNNAHIAVFGVGGVGGNCIEALARSGIGSLSIYDNDCVSITNINRQVVALHSTIDQPKVIVMKQRLLDINPQIQVNAYEFFVDKESINTIDFTHFDYIVDCIDTVSAKLLLIEKAKEHQLPIISCMGTGNKFDPTQLKIMDIAKTKYCPLAKVMRHELKKRHIDKVKVLSSYEKPCKPKVSEENTTKRMVPGSTSFVPSVAGIIIAREVIMDLI